MKGGGGYLNQNNRSHIYANTKNMQLFPDVIGAVGTNSTKKKQCNFV